MQRRDFLKTAGLAAGALALGGARPAPAARAGRDVAVHLLPTVSHDRLLLKASFAEPLDRPPVLRVGGRRVRGIRTDTDGTHWAFHATALRPGKRHHLDLRQAGRRLTEPWSIRTFPAPDASPTHVRLLVYTCAGGFDPFGLYVPTAVRQRLLRRGLAHEPDAVIAIGDHVYWDLRAGLNALLTGASAIAKELAGEFDRAIPVLGTSNESVMKRAVGPQIAGLYGTMLRGTPVFFMRDDHDYFEDDRVEPDLTTFPPDPFMRALARATQWLYYPEFLPDPARPRDLPGTGACDRPSGVSEAFGTLRYGRLLEALLYDCKGFCSVGPDARIVPPAVEAWLAARMADPAGRHVVNVPSNPPGWSAGKYMEWYADVVAPSGELTTELPKDGWQPGWRAQHDRLLAAASAMPRLPLFVSGDIHSIAEERVLGSGAHDFGANPIVSLISGTPGTGIGWPSLSRGTLATPPASLATESIVPVQELNGFHLLDVEPDRVTIRHFRWDRARDPVEAIDALEPFHVSVHARGGARPLRGAVSGPVGAGCSDSRGTGRPGRTSS